MNPIAGHTCCMGQHEGPEEGYFGEACFPGHASHVSNRWPVSVLQLFGHDFWATVMVWPYVV